MWQILQQRVRPMSWTLTLVWPCTWNRSCEVFQHSTDLQSLTTKWSYCAWIVSVSVCRWHQYYAIQQAAKQLMHQLSVLSLWCLGLQAWQLNVHAVLAFLKWWWFQLRPAVHACLKSLQCFLSEICSYVLIAGPGGNESVSARLTIMILEQLTLSTGSLGSKCKMALQGQGSEE